MTLRPLREISFAVRRGSAAVLYQGKYLKKNIFRRFFHSFAAPSKLYLFPYSSPIPDTVLIHTTAVYYRIDNDKSPDS